MQSVSTRIFGPARSEVKPIMTSKPVTTEELAVARRIAIAVPLCIILIAAALFTLA